MLSTFVHNLANYCRAHVLEEKWVVAPTARVGYQWLDRAARAGYPACNAHVKTPTTFALGLAAPLLTAEGLSFLRGARLDVVVDRVFGRLRKRKGKGYLASLDPSPGLTRTLARTLRDLRTARVRSEGLAPEAFETDTKGDELGFLLAEFEKELQQGAWADAAGMLERAERACRTGGVPAGVRIILPADAFERDFNLLEKALWSAVPEGQRILLRGDDPEEPSGDGDARLLGFVSSPSTAPKPRGDGTARIFRAAGEVNEVREVLRRIVGQSIPFDHVEIIPTDGATYVPLLYELCFRFQGEDDHGVPVTFAEGIPVRYARPGRALEAWMTWVRQGHPQSVLRRMIQDGLLSVDVDPARVSFARLGRLFRSLPIGLDRDRYLPALENRMRAVRAKLAGRDGDEEGDGDEGRRERAGTRLAALVALKTIVAGLLEHAPGPQASQDDILSGAAWFLRHGARTQGRLDEYARERLEGEVDGLRRALDPEEPAEGLDAWVWLADLCSTSAVLGMGPRPGRLYVSNLRTGGHSGREHTFVVGLDDRRFPGAGTQDPLLLDEERSGLSPDLRRSAERPERNVDELRRLFGRLRGSVTLSYTARTLEDDREAFPSPVVLAAHRIVSGERDADQEDMDRALGPPASFASPAAAGCATSLEWWVQRLAGQGPVARPEEALGAAFPHLARGYRARDERGSDRFTAFDGNVPEAGEDHNPYRDDARPLSATRLELLGSCPLDYFFAHVLGIEPPEEEDEDPGVWLDARTRGSLLHDVFEDFMTGLTGDGKVPVLSRDRKRLQRILDGYVAAYLEENPCPNDVVFAREVEGLRLTCNVFLSREEEHCKTVAPAYFEASIGMEPPGDPTALDVDEPVPILLPDGGRVRARGRIDRIDRVPGASPPVYHIWDYKTGGTYGYEQGKPFRQGRKVQSILYTLMLEKVLKERVEAGATVGQFGYFFPGPRARGLRIFWSREQLDPGREVLARLCDMLAAGCFPYTDREKDLTFSAYEDAVSDVAAAMADIKRKLDNEREGSLDLFRSLRPRRRRRR